MSATLTHHVVDDASCLRELAALDSCFDGLLGLPRLNEVVDSSVDLLLAHQPVTPFLLNLDDGAAAG